MKKFLLFLLLPMVAFALGQAGSSLTFDNTDDYVMVPNNALLNNLVANYTMEAWINFAAYVNYNRIIDRDQVFAFYIDPSGKVGFRGPAGSPVSVLSNTVLSTGTWYHVAIQVTDAGGGQSTGQMFINGVADGPSVTHASLQLPPQTTALYIGNRFDAARPFNGIIDEVRIWTVARPAAQIAADRGKPLTGSEAGLLAYYKFDEGSGQTTADATANGLNGQLGSTGGGDANDPVWTTPSTAPVGFNLTFPNGGEVLTCGAPVNVTWYGDPVPPTVNVFVSFDGGTSWVQIGSGVPNSGTFATVVPGFPTAQARFRVASGTAHVDDSDANITFNSVGFTPVYISREAENANLFQHHMYSSVDGEAFNCRFIYSSRNWTDSSPAGIAEYNFTITQPGLYVVWARIWGAGSTRNSWLVSMDGGPEKHFHTTKGSVWRWNVVTNGTSYETPTEFPVYFYLNAGAHTLRFRGREHYTRLDRIIITNNLNPGYSGPEPNQWIRITQPATEITHPQIVRNSLYEIKWESYNIASTVTIEFSAAGEFDFPYLIARNTPNDGSFIWQVPDITTNDGWLRISEGSGTTCPADVTWERIYIIDPPPEITVLSPNGGETWIVGSTHAITWQSRYYTGNINLYFSSDNGATWSTIALNEPDDGSYNWIVPEVISNQCLIKVVAAAGGAPWDVSDAVFSIIPPPAPTNITVTEPNGGEAWIVGSVHPITWTVDNYTANVNIYYSTNNGSTWTLVAENLSAFDVYEWTIPNTVSTQCLVKVADAATGTPFDVSDAVFSIVPEESPAPPPNFALQFDGINDVVEVANHASLNVSHQFTIEFWMKTDEPTQKWRRILEKGSFDEYYIAFYGETRKMAGALRTAIPGGSSMTNVLGPSSSLLVPNTWVHVAATFDGSTARFYINGVLESSKPATAAPRNLVKDLIIGGAKHGSIFEYHYKGILDELRIWNIVKSGAEITAAMMSRLTGSEPGLAAYYNFDEGTGQVLHDLSPNANHGKLGHAEDPDDADPVWVLSDRPTTMAMMAMLPQGPASLDDELAEIAEIPQEFELMQNYPNPFNASTTIGYNVPNPSVGDALKVTLEIYDLNGRLMKTLVNTTQAAGYHQVVWNGIDEAGNTVPSGIYFYRLRAGNFVETKSMVLLK